MASSFLRYTFLRFTLFVACLAVASLLGWFSLEGVVAAILVSSALSWFLLRAPREQLARELAERVEQRGPGAAGRSGPCAPPRAGRRSRWDLDTEAEDAEADRAEAGPRPDRG